MLLKKGTKIRLHDVIDMEFDEDSNATEFAEDILHGGPEVSGEAFEVRDLKGNILGQACHDSDRTRLNYPPSTYPSELRNKYCRNEAQEWIDHLTYRNYAYNRRRLPNVSPEYWKKFYGAGSITWLERMFHDRQLPPKVEGPTVVDRTVSADIREASGKLDEATDGPKELRYGCDRCHMSLSVDGLVIHELGCPNERKTWVPEGGWVRYVECPDCGSEVEEGKSCSHVLPMDED